MKLTPGEVRRGWGSQIGICRREKDRERERANRRDSFFWLSISSHYPKPLKNKGLKPKEINSWGGQEGRRDVKLGFAGERERERERESELERHFYLVEYISPVSAFTGERKIERERIEKRALFG